MNIAVKTEDVVELDRIHKEAPGEIDDSDITLRRHYLSDADDIVEWVQDEKFRERWPYGTSKEEAKEFIAYKAIPHPWCRAICVHDKPVGTIKVNPSGNRAHMGSLWISSRYSNKWFSILVLRWAVATIFVDWPQVERFETMVDAEDRNTQRVLEKIGFTKEGVLRKYYCCNGESRDIAVFSLLFSDIGVQTPRPAMVYHYDRTR